MLFSWRMRIFERGYSTRGAIHLYREASCRYVMNVCVVYDTRHVTPREPRETRPGPPVHTNLCGFTFESCATSLITSTRRIRKVLSATSARIDAAATLLRYNINQWARKLRCVSSRLRKSNFSSNLSEWPLDPCRSGARQTFSRTRRPVNRYRASERCSLLTVCGFDYFCNYTQH